MIFTSISFLVFLVVVLAVYWRLPRRGQNLFLLAASYFFYGFVHPWFCILVAATTLVDYCIALGMERYPAHKRPLLWVSLISNLGLLGTYKYFDFFAASAQAALARLGIHVTLPLLDVMLPVGISFYTFQSLSYTIDVYRGTLRARRNFLDVALFVILYPQLVAGPIERASHLLPQIERERTLDFARIESGACLIVWGFFKKLVIADNLAVYVDRLYAMPTLPGLLVLAAGMGFVVQVFADFSAYTDIARGSARLMGFELMHNFRAPFGASNPPEFWRRWHISLSSWIRDYVYTPLLGDRTSRWARSGCQIATFLIFGLWHGAGWNFVLWGLYMGLASVAYLLWIRPWTKRVTRPAAERLLFLGGLVTWNLLHFAGGLLFRQHNLSTLLGYFTRNPFAHTPEQLVVAVGTLCTVAGFAAPMLIQPLMRRWLPDSRPVRVALAWACLAAVVFLAQEGTLEFVYFAF
jgi:alginate O-acetyltransferase complex protein AlgI